MLAATAKHLTTYPTTWRLCDNDEDYVIWLLPLLTSHGQDAVAIEHDCSVHGKSVAHQLSASIKPAEDPQQAATTFLPVVSRMRWSGQPTGHTTLLKVLV